MHIFNRFLDTQDQVNDMMLEKLHKMAMDAPKQKKILRLNIRIFKGNHARND